MQAYQMPHAWRLCNLPGISFALMGLVFHYLLEPAAERMTQKLPPRTVRAVCLVVLFAFVVDCILSTLFRTPITY